MYYAEEECSKLINRIRKACEEKGWSNYVLAKQAGISTSTVHDIMNGKTTPQLYTLLQICNVLNMSVGELFSEKESGNKEAGQGLRSELSRDEEILIQGYRELTEEKKEQMRACVEMLRSHNNGK